MVATSFNKISAIKIANGIAAGEFTAEAVMRDCLDHIEAREGTVSAWASIDPDLAMAEARARDKTTPKGVLAGVPIGVKWARLSIQAIAPRMTQHAFHSYAQPAQLF